MARQNRSYVRRTEDENRVDVVIVVDTSHSMAYAGGASARDTVQKLEVAKTLAAACAFIAQHPDAAGLSLFAGSEKNHLPARGSTDQFGHICAALVDVKAEGGTALKEVLAKVCDRLKRKTVVIVISDFIDCGVEALSALGILRKRGSDAIVFQVLHEDEIDFTFDGVVKFEDLEGDREVQVDAPLVKQAYQAELARFLHDVEDACGKNDARYALVRADQSPVPSIARALEAQNASASRTGLR
jgi:uncharacterized protein (DUF58 family)